MGVFHQVALTETIWFNKRDIFRHLQFQERLDGSLILWRQLFSGLPFDRPVFFLCAHVVMVIFWPPPHDKHPSFASEALVTSFILCMSSIGCTWLPWRAPSYSNLHQLNLAPTYHEQTNFNHNPSFQRNIPYPTPYLHPDQDNLLFFLLGDHPGSDMHSRVCFLGPLPLVRNGLVVSVVLFGNLKKCYHYPTVRPKTSMLEMKLGIPKSIQKLPIHATFSHFRAWV